MKQLILTSDAAEAGSKLFYQKTKDKDYGKVDYQVHYLVHHKREV